MSVLHWRQVAPLSSTLTIAVMVFQLRIVSGTKNRVQRAQVADDLVLSSSELIAQSGSPSSGGPCRTGRIL